MSYRECGGDDILYGGTGMDLLAGFGGNDFLDGGANNDELQGGLWRRRALKVAAVAMIASLGRRADDTLSVMKAMTNFREMSETIRFSVAKVMMRCLAKNGNDILSEAGDDLLNGGLGNDELDGGDGIDDVQGREGKIFCRWRWK